MAHRCGPPGAVARGTKLRFHRIKAGKRQGKKLLQWYLADASYSPTPHHAVLLKHLAELFPRHIQIHYGQYQRAQLFEAARRSRACAYLADDDHGPLALQEILLAGCPTVGVRTGASFVKSGETGVLVDRLPPGRQCAETDEDERAWLSSLKPLKKRKPWIATVCGIGPAGNSTPTGLWTTSSRL